MSKVSRQVKRRNARRYAMQALYLWQFNQLPAPDLIVDFIDEHDMSATDIDYFSHLVTNALKHLQEVDDIMRPCLSRDLSELNPVELAVLRLAVYEFKYRLDIPYRVVINEAIDLTNEYGADQGFRFVNGVLDALAPKLRPIEKNAS